MIARGGIGITFNLDASDFFIFESKVFDRIGPSVIGVDLPFIHKRVHLKTGLSSVHGPYEADPDGIDSTGPKHRIVDVLCAAHIIDISWVLENGVTRKPEASQSCVACDTTLERGRSDVETT
jgi:hypothetical protein